MQAAHHELLMRRLIRVPENFQGWNKPLKAGIWGVTSLMVDLRRLFARYAAESAGSVPSENNWCA